MQTVFRERSFEATQYNGTLLLLLLPKNCTRQFCVLTSFGLKFFYFTVVSVYNEVSLSLNSILAIWRGLGIIGKISVRPYEYLKYLGLTTLFSRDHAHTTLEFVPETFLSSCIGHAIMFTFYEIVYEAFPFYFPNLQNTSS